MLEKEIISKIRELHTEGVRQKDIASKLGISTVTVRKYLKSAVNYSRIENPESSRLVASFTMNTTAHYPELHYGKLGSLIQGCAMRNLPIKLNELFNNDTSRAILKQIQATGMQRGHFVVNLYNQKDGTPNVKVKAYPKPYEANHVTLPL